MVRKKQTNHKDHEWYCCFTSHVNGWGSKDKDGEVRRWMGKSEFVLQRIRRRPSSKDPSRVRAQLFVDATSVGRNAIHSMHGVGSSMEDTPTNPRQAILRVFMLSSRVPTKTTTLGFSKRWMTIVSSSQAHLKEERHHLCASTRPRESSAFNTPLTIVFPKPIPSRQKQVLFLDICRRTSRADAQGKMSCRVYISSICDLHFGSDQSSFSKRDSSLFEEPLICLKRHWCETNVSK